MEQLYENPSEQVDSSTSTPPASLGNMLREARERLGLSVADVAHQIKFAPRQIESLEADDFQRLPEMMFLRGFVRSYAKILNLDAQPLLATLPPAKEVSAHLTPVSVEVLFPDTHSSQRQNMIWLGAAFLFAVLGGTFLVWHYIAPDTKTKTARIEPPLFLPEKIQTIPVSNVPEVSVIALSASSAVQPSSGAVQPPVQAVKPQALPQVQSIKTDVQPDAVTQVFKLRLEFDEDSWVEIKDKDDKILSSQVNLRGSELRLSGQAPFSLVIGHAASVRLYHRGKQVDLTPHTGSSSEVARLKLE